MNLLTKQKDTDLENKLIVAEGKGQGVWDDHVHTLFLEWITNKDLLHSTWNSAQCYVAAWMGVGFGREWIHALV